jgi:hypothetical protein
MRADELLSKIEQYAAHIGVTANAVSIAAYGNSNPVANLRRDSDPRPSTITTFVRFMNANPEGDDYLRSRMRKAARKYDKRLENKASHKSHAPKMHRVANPIDASRLDRVDRDPCFRCGVRKHKWGRKGTIYRDQCFVYFIKADVGETSFVKIAFTTDDVKKRLRVLQLGSPVPLVLLGWVDAVRQLEVDLHNKYAEYHSHREWYYLSSELEAHIADMLSETVP